MDNQEETLKFERTTQEQLHYYTMFCKQHPELQRGKRTSTNPQALQMLWSELAETLNALRGPTRTATKWKKTLMHWKNQLRSRARKFKAHAKITGGDHPKLSILKFEYITTDTVPSAAPSPSPVSAPVHDSAPAPSPSKTATSSASSPPILPSPAPSISTSIVSEAPKPTRVLGAVLKKIDANKRREEQVIALQQKILEQNKQLTSALVQMARERRKEQQKVAKQNQQMTRALSQMTRALTATTTVLNQLEEKLNN
ncbi:PREDICTED: ensconsin-like [Bactrocera latifrons]|uniref:Regulatory protein zeste n=1 Tax=Bactrocera latifrons TaxID=174628 RepID=A0A0K8U2X3_BACLA|nr:PREDICTED: ensconsin-like [Bactrocera latifrons]XP_018789575.1 PREDICTED: ensconsin-like [Bactrocera latifrons]XP_018789576.1 PREDICTED: ensconsin-like [Bactrocera latifrons]XP_018789577.1 PREDICTED: ensconsin-like [Bactrocera latifrons]XP_018789578.1 PREDICTED: ensconsin-like [Bactrocera latifrons]XP_018789579.1 PREDICTED: ensconsin-like [Bactrocera latifrons]